MQINSSLNMTNYLNKKIYFETNFKFDHFLQSLKQKKLEVGIFNEKFLFENLFELFSTLKPNKVPSQFDLRSNFISFVKNCSNLAQIHPSLEFLNKYPSVVSHFIQDVDSMIFTGLLLIAFTSFAQVNIKIYQFLEDRSLISIELGEQEFKETHKIGLVVLQDGLKFCYLQKLKENNLHNYFSVNSHKISQVSTLSSQETTSLKIIQENLGFFPQVLLSYFDLLQEKNFYSNSQAKICKIMDNVVRNIKEGESLDPKHNGKIRLENLGFEYISSSFKREIFFGNHLYRKTIPEMQAKTPSCPPGLKEKYFENIEKFGETCQNIPKTLINLEDAYPNNGNCTKEDESKDKASKKPIIVDQNNSVYYIGRLKFIDEGKKFGFMVKENDNSDLFFHLSDVEASGIDLKSFIQNKELRYKFTELKYIGKHNLSKKAIDFKLYKEFN